jgi:hypothetical protein
MVRIKRNYGTNGNNGTDGKEEEKVFSLLCPFPFVPLFPFVP